MQLIDSHAHVVDSGKPLPQMMAEMQAAFRACGFGAVCFACNPCEGFHAIYRNLLAFLIKLTYPESTYVYAGLDYHLPGTSDDSFGFAEQARRMATIGADGYKMYEGKPNARKECGSIPLDGGRYDGFYAELEQRSLPLSIHLGDPPEFWDLDAAGAYQVEKGWFFGDLTYVGWPQLFDEVMAVVAAHPKLSVIIPQFGYLLPDLSSIGALLDQYPNLHFDIAPAGEGYTALAADPAAGRDFFTRYADRLLFACTGVCEDWAAAPQKPARIRAVLDKLDLPDAVAEKVYGGNFARLTPPRPVDLAALRAYGAFVADRLGRYPAAAAEKPVVARTLEVIRAIEDFKGPKEGSQEEGCT